MMSIFESLTPGTIMLYCGLAGIALTIVTAIPVSITLAISNKRIKKRLNQEYGES